MRFNAYATQISFIVRCIGEMYAGTHPNSLVVLVLLQLTDYDKGFYVPLNCCPSARSSAQIGRRPAIHARVTAAITIGRFTRATGDLLCGAGEALECKDLDRSLNAVTCSRCRTLMDRWARDAVARRCKGYAITCDGVTRAVAATSAVMAGELMGIDKGLMVRRGIRSIELWASGRDRYQDIRKALKANDVGTVVAMMPDSGGWSVEPSRVEVGAIMGWRHERFAERGQRVSEATRLHNRSIRLAPYEVAQLKALGGASWLRSVIDAGASTVPNQAPGEATMNATVRTTHTQWGIVLASGGSAWIRALIRDAGAAASTDANAPI